MRFFKGRANGDPLGRGKTLTDRHNNKLCSTLLFIYGQETGKESLKWWALDILNDIS